MIEKLTIPDDRIGIVVGRRGAVLKKLRRASKTIISVQGNEVMIEGEALNVWNAKNVLNAVIHGFSPNKAFEILGGKIYEEIDLTRNVPKDRISTVKSRIIGRNGRTRELLEEFTNSHLSITDKKVYVIADEDKFDTLLEALSMLVGGVSHRAVYAFLEKRV